MVWPDVAIVQSAITIVVTWQLSTGSIHDYISNIFNHKISHILFTILLTKHSDKTPAHTSIPWLHTHTHNTGRKSWHTNLRGIKGIKIDSNRFVFLKDVTVWSITMDDGGLYWPWLIVLSNQGNARNGRVFYSQSAFYHLMVEPSIKVIGCWDRHVWGKVDTFLHKKV